MDNVTNIRNTFDEAIFNATFLKTSRTETKILYIYLVEILGFEEFNKLYKRYEINNNSTQTILEIIHSKITRKQLDEYFLKNFEKHFKKYQDLMKEREENQ